MHRLTAFPAAAPRVVRAGELTESTAQTTEGLRHRAVSRDLVRLNSHECSYASLSGRRCEP